MRRIGVLGGMSWESTAEYYRLLNEIAAKRLGGLHSADLLVRSVDFAEIEGMQVAGEWDRAGERLAEEAATLSDAGAEVIVHRIIYEELCLGVFEESSRQAYLEVVDRLVEAGCEGVILGCTEIELLLPMETYAGVRLFPTTRLHCEAAIEAALSA